MTKRQIIFISCGQVTDEEKKLGAAICRLVEELTPFRPYFAEYQSSLDGLSKNILGALDKAVGLIAVLHPRGVVRFPDGSERVRASVWVEQEIAVASYLTQIAGRKLHLAAYTHILVEREGMRDQLLLNPQNFSTSEQVLAHLTDLLPRWGESEVNGRPDVGIRIEHRKSRISAERHEYQLQVIVLNQGIEPIEKYYMELLFPSDFLEQSTVHSFEIKERRTPTHQLFRITQDEKKRILFPGDPVSIYTMDYFVDQRLFWRNNGHFPETVRADLVVPGKSSARTEVAMQELQSF
jgi:hypothetical protein